MSGSSNTEKRLEEMLKPVVERMGYEMVDIEFVKEGQTGTLELLWIRTEA